MADHKGARSWYEKGYRMTFSGRFTEALEAFDTAIRQDAHFAAAHVGRGVCHHKLGQRGKALDDIRKAALLGSQAAGNFLVRIDALQGLPGEKGDIKSIQPEKAAGGEAEGTSAAPCPQDQAPPFNEGREATLSSIKRLIEEINRPFAKQTK